MNNQIAPTNGRISFADKVAMVFSLAAGAATLTLGFMGLLPGG